MAGRKDPQGCGAACVQLAHPGHISLSHFHRQTDLIQLSRRCCKGRELVRGLGELGTWLVCSWFAVQQRVNANFPFAQRC